jgi:hypothetical protein
MNAQTTVAQNLRSALPPDPAEAAIASVRWRRTGLLGQLVKIEPEADAPVTEHEPIVSEATARRAA